ncbi:MAG: hypothetical protein COV70_02010 [Parcubacteria group bacterium CG11_big_fil_rev_8_21_14_0_20_39_22]|nr:MAG: hypothetical protein COV70_02010 [Parcubacteria group bacterium CG11_big_fil_rev_8_21_14_0_20_39_22]
MSASKNRYRFLIIGAITVILFLILIIKLYVVQIIHADEYSLKANRQYVSAGNNIFNRGSIFFTDKDGGLVSGATMKLGFTLAINPTEIENPKLVYEKLSQVIELDVDRETFIARASKVGDPYEEVAVLVEKEDAKRIEDLKIKGVNLYASKWRYYPGGNLAAHILGFVGFKEDKVAGRYGLESYYENTLSRDEESLYVNFFAEAFSNLGEIVKSDSNRKGNVVTTIEPTVQAFLEGELDSIQEKWASKSSGAIVIDPKSGEVVAMAISPDFDPNNFSSADPNRFSNPLVSSVYEMGSIVKPLTIAAGIDSGAINKDSSYFDEGYIMVNGARISNHDRKGRGKATMQDVLSQSLNTGVAHVVMKMGKEDFSTYMKNFGLGEETGIDLPGEVRGLIGNLDSPRDIEHVTASFGQGIALTPIGIVRALSSIANKGVMPDPHIVDSIDYDVGFKKKLSRSGGERVISEETASAVTNMLVNAVDTGLSGGKEKMERYSIAAKTGTAQIADENKRGYYDDRFLHSFFGFFPAYNPRFLVFYFTVEPKGAEYANYTLTDPFFNTAKFLINYYDIEPDR